MGGETPGMWVGVPPHCSHSTLLPPNCPEGRLTEGKKQDLMPWSRAKSSATVKDHWAPGWTCTLGLSRNAAGIQHHMPQ